MKPTLTDDDIAAAYRAAAQEAPGAELDARILAAARQQLADRAQEKKRSSGGWWRRWRVPVSVTAVAVLGVSLSFRVSEEAAVREQHREQKTVDGRAATQSDAAPAGAVMNALPPASTTRPAPSATDQPQPKPEARAALAPPASRDRGPATAPSAATLQPKAQPFPATSAATPAATPAASPAPAAPATLAAPAPARAANTLADDSRQRSERRSADALAAEASRAERESAAVPLRQRRDAATPADSTVDRKSTLGAAGAMAESAAPAAAKSAAKKEVDSASHRATPERWLDQIRQLKRNGQTQAAQEELRRFREQHPDYVLPADLR